MAAPPPPRPQPQRPHPEGSGEGSAWPKQDSGEQRPSSGSGWPDPRHGPGSTVRTSDSGGGSAWPRATSGTGSAWPVRQGPGSTVRHGAEAQRGHEATVRERGAPGAPAAPGPTGTVRETGRGQGSSWSDSRLAGSQSSWPGAGGRGRRLPQPGQLLGPYRIDAVLGQGSMGRVFRATDPTGRPVAIKAVLVDMADQEGLERFVREGQAMAAIPPHAGVVRVHAAGEAQGVPFLVFELIEGESLEQRLQREQRLPLGEALELARRLAEALDHIHRQGVVHRDLKPANVLLRRDAPASASDPDADAAPRATCRPCLADFGLARLTGAESLTATGDLLGTPLYMPPEQVMGLRSEVDARSDVWSLGVILYRMCSGEVPFRGASFNETAEAILESEPRPLHTLVEGAGPALTSVVERALAKDKEDRYPDARAFADALADLTDGRATRASIVGLFSRGRRRTLARVGLAAALAALLVAVLTAVVVSRVAHGRAQALAGEVQALQEDADHATSDLLAADPAALDELAARLEAVRARDERGRFAERLELVAASVARGRFAAALSAGDLAAAARVTIADAPPEELALRAALLAQARGDLPALEGFEPLLERSDRLGEAARVLFARAWRERDPARALRYLRSATGPVAERERRWARLLQAVDERDAALVTQALKQEPDAGLRARARARAVSATLALLSAEPQRPVTEVLASLRVINAASSPARDPELERRLVLECMTHLERAIHSGQAVGPDGAERAPGGDLSPSLDDLVELFHQLSRLRVPVRIEPPRNLAHVLFKDARKQITYDDVIKVAIALVHLDVPIPASLVGTAPYGPEEQRRLAASTDPGARYVALSIRAAQPRRMGEDGRRQLLEYLDKDPWARGELGPRNRAQALSWSACALDLSLARRRQAVDEALRLDPESYYVRSAQALALAFERKLDEAAALGERVLVEFEQQQREKEGRRAETIPPYVLRRVVLIHALRGDRERVNHHLRQLSSYPVIGKSTLEDAQELLPR